MKSIIFILTALKSGSIKTITALFARSPLQKNHFKNRKEKSGITIGNELASKHAMSDYR